MAVVILWSGEQFWDQFQGVSGRHQEFKTTIAGVLSTRKTPSDSCSLPGVVTTESPVEYVCSTLIGGTQQADPPETDVCLAKAKLRELTGYQEK
jgi:hypothetical protein